MSQRMRQILTVGILLAWALFLWWAESNLDAYYVRVLNTAAIYVVAAVSYTLINGIAGQFSLGPNGFMALGGYVVALLILPLAQKEMGWILEPLVWPFNAFALPQRFFPLAILAGGLVAALGGLVVGFPSLRLRGDYLAIATFGFGEIIFVLANNLIGLTNGAMGIKGIPNYATLWWTWGWAVFTIWVVRNLAQSSFGRAMKAIREDEVAAAAMGINVFRLKLLALVVSAFFGGVAGGLLAALISTVSPTIFTFTMTFNLLVIIVLGGLGSITGAAVTAVLFTVLQELLRVVESPLRIGPLQLPGVSGMRMVIFSVLLVILMLFYRRGLFGRSEFSWEWVLGKFRQRGMASASSQSGNLEA